MKEMTLATLIAVFQEMLGGWFWILVLLGVAVFVALAVILVRDKRLYAARLIRAEIGGVFGGIFAVWLALAVTNSSLADAGGANRLAALRHAFRYWGGWGDDPRLCRSIADSRARA